MKVSIIAAVAQNNIIGVNNNLPWHLPADLKYFKATTLGHHIIMGRKTFESFRKALPGRTNVIITRNKNYEAENAIVTSSLKNALALAKEAGEQEAFILGGGEIYKQAMELTDRLYITRVFHDFDGDTSFPEIDESVWKLVSNKFHEPDEKNAHPFAFQVFEK